MKKILKITIIAILISFFIAPFIIPNEVEAVTMDEVFKSAKDFLTAGDSASKDYTEINTDRL